MDRIAKILKQIRKWTLCNYLVCYVCVGVCFGLINGYNSVKCFEKRYPDLNVSGSTALPGFYFGALGWPIVMITDGIMIASTGSVCGKVKPRE